MLVKQFLLHTFLSGRKRLGVEGHKSQFFQHNRIVHRLHGIFSPGERPMAMDQHRRNLIGRQIAEGLHDHIAGFFFVLAMDFFRCHLSCTGDLSIEIITVGRTVGRNAPPGLGPRGRPTGMGVHHAANVREGVV